MLRGLRGKQKGYSCTEFGLCLISREQNHTVWITKLTALEKRSSYINGMVNTCFV